MAVAHAPVVLGGLVGAMLAIAGASYQGAFSNPLADPYLLGVASGAGLGATLVVVGAPVIGQIPSDLLPLAAFAGAVLAVTATFALGRSRASERSSASLLLAGVAVAAFFTAVQTFLLQRSTPGPTAARSTAGYWAACRPPAGDRWTWSCRTWVRRSLCCWLAAASWT